MVERSTANHFTRQRPISVINKDEHQIIEDAEWGHLRVEPIPHDDELSVYYESKYYDLIQQGGKALELQRLIAGGKEADTTRSWLRHTLSDTLINALQSAPGKRVLDVGCGIGEFIGYANSQGFKAQGVEPAKQAVEMAHSQGLNVKLGNLAGYAQDHPNSRFDAIVFLNVIEHSPEPMKLLQQARELLCDDGLLICRLPNDFSHLQKLARQRNNSRRWWVVIPDHINYFNFTNFPPILERLGFKIEDTLGDYPMEFFLLMGRDYIAHPELGKACHLERVALEMSMPAEQLRAMYRGFASSGIGRNALFVARKN